MSENEKPKEEVMSSLVDDEWESQRVIKDFPTEEEVTGQPAQGTGFYYDLDLDGETYRVEGATQQEAFDAALQYQQQHYARKRFAEIPMPDLTRPEAGFVPGQDYEPLNQDKLTSLLLQFNRDPVEAVGRFMEEYWNRNPESRSAKQLRAAEIQEGERMGNLAGDYFRGRHPEYFACDENRDMMIKYMYHQNMDFSNPGDFEIAYQDLRNEGLLLDAPDGEGYEQGFSAPAPTALSGRGTATAPQQSSAEGLSEEEMIAELDKMSLEDLGALARASRRAVRRTGSGS